MFLKIVKVNMINCILKIFLLSCISLYIENWLLKLEKCLNFNKILIYSFVGEAPIYAKMFNLIIFQKIEEKGNLIHKKLRKEVVVWNGA